jgi:tRNA nucleotidyltransferase/poly(A) polymerase
MKELAPFISKMSIERITGELMKAATSGKSLANYIILLDKYGILQTFLPEVKALQNFKHSIKHHPEGNAWQHTLKALESITSTNPLVNLAVLFHDIGKATTFVQKEDGTPSYNGHEEQSVELFKTLAKRLKFSNEDINAITFGIANHMKAHRFNEMNKNTILTLRQSPYWEILKQVMIADELARGGSLNALQSQFDLIENIVKDFGEKKEFENKMATFITGNMIINKAKELGYDFTKNNSKQIGIIKQKIRDLVFKNNWNITSEEVQKYLEELIIELKQGDTHANNLSRPNTDDTAVYTNQKSSDISRY